MRYELDLVVVVVSLSGGGEEDNKRIKVHQIGHLNVDHKRYSSNRSSPFPKYFRIQTPHFNDSQATNDGEDAWCWPNIGVMN